MVDSLFHFLFIRLTHTPSYNCGGVGHMSRDCTSGPQAGGGGGGGGGQKCYNCGESVRVLLIARHIKPDYFDGRDISVAVRSTHMPLGSAFSKSKFNDGRMHKTPGVKNLL